MIYSVQFGRLWPSIRIGLLSDGKYGALFNNFSDVERVSRDLESQNVVDFIWESQKVLHSGNSTAERKASEPAEAQTETFEPQTEPLSSHSASISPNIKCYTFPKGDISLFPPARCVTDGDGVVFFA